MIIKSVKKMKNIFGDIYILLFFFGIICSNFLVAQEEFVYSVQWYTFKSKFNDSQIDLPIIKENGYIDNRVSFTEVFDLKSNNYQYEITNVVYQNVEEIDLNYLNKFQIKVPKSLDYSLKVTFDKGSSKLVFNCFPYVNENGVLKKLISLKLSPFTPITSLKSKNKSTFKNQSVLSQGEWFKIPISKDGVYKIDFDFLQQMGVDVANLNTNSIHIFGNGEGKLPELNSIFRTDDLAQNAVLYFDGGDGQFDSGDFLLFYAWGPDRWYYDLSNSYRDKNIYSDNSYYFLTISSSINSLRINNSILQTASSPSIFFDYYNDLQIHELESVSIVKGGQRWYGELFDVSLSYDLNFDFNDLHSQNMDVSFAIASNATSSSGNSFSIKTNNQIIYSTSLPQGDYSRKEVSFSSSTIPSDNILNLYVQRSSPSVISYLDYLQVSLQKKIKYNQKQFNFRNLNAIENGGVSEYSIQNLSSNEIVWDISKKQIPENIVIDLANSIGKFSISCDTLLEFVCFNVNDAFVPSLGQKIKTQNLHGLPQADMVIVTPLEFINQANRLAELHRDEGLLVNVVNIYDVYNEFSSGMLDPTGIRDLMRMFYVRAQTQNSLFPKYLLLFGDGTYDPKNRISNNNNFIPTYQVVNSEYLLTAMVTDDYFGMMDEDESIESTDLLDIAVGRLLISSNEIANQQVDKIEHYMKNGGVLDVDGTCFGDWKNKYSFITDDEENGYFIKQDAEPNSIYVKDSFPSMLVEKIYCDAFQQVSNAGGQRYPEVNDLITSSIQNGVLVMNYIGHGGEKGAAEERIITIPQIQEWKNKNHLNLFVSATCEFTRFDDPQRLSAGEWISLNSSGGAIALMTTTRPVFFGVNTMTGKTFYKYVFSRDSLNQPLTFGEIIRLTKNNTGSSDNKRSFTLIGDPALKISLPRYKIVTDSINGLTPLFFQDTIRALSKMKVKAHVEDYEGNILTNFNGFAIPSVYDKAISKYTLGQDVSSPIIEYEEQNNMLFKGKSSINNGKFEFEFIVPKDIKFQFGTGKISYYGYDMNEDASGNDERFIVGGIDTNAIEDVIGPEIKVYLNDSSFIEGGLTDENPLFYAQLFDESGINTVGNGVGHDITLVLDDQTSNPIVLNNYYISDLNTYKSGQVSYQLNNLSEGEHTLLFKVWDVNNNSSQLRYNFIVRRKEDVALSHVLNYPNPFSTSTTFFFEHNQLNQEVQIQIQVFTVTGALVKTINQSVFMDSYRSNEIQWDGLDDFGDKIATGVYLYKLTLRTSDGKTLSKVEKLFKI